MEYKTNLRMLMFCKTGLSYQNYKKLKINVKTWELKASQNMIKVFNK